MKRAVFAALLGALCSGAPSAETLGLRFVVSDHLAQTGTQRRQTEARLAQHTAQLNAYFADSQVLLAAEVVRIDFAPIANREALAVLADMEQERGGFEGLFAQADEFGADYTFAVLDDLVMRGKRGCGRGYAVNKTLAEIASTRRAFAVVDIVCGAHTLAHELGHLLGLNHGALVDACLPGKGHKTALTPYANGYGQGVCDKLPQPGEFGTIMVGGFMQEVNGDGHSALPLFSNPRLKDPRCGLQGVCGDAETADAVRALNEHAGYYADHEAPDVHVLHYASPALAQCLAERYRGKEVGDLDELLCPGMGIDSLAGLERLAALRRIDLSGNPVADIGPLLALDAARLEWIDLSDSGIDPSSLRQLQRHFGGKLKDASTSHP